MTEINITSDCTGLTSARVVVDSSGTNTFYCTIYANSLYNTYFKINISVDNLKTLAGHSNGFNYVEATTVKDTAEGNWGKNSRYDSSFWIDSSTTFSSGQHTMTNAFVGKRMITNSNILTVYDTFYFTLVLIVPTRYYLTLHAGTGGYVSPNSSVLVGAGSTYQIKATPSSKYDFVNWSDGDTSAERTITMPSSNLDLTAYFAEQTAVIRVQTGESTYSDNVVGLNSSFTFPNISYSKEGYTASKYVNSADSSDVRNAGSGYFISTITSTKGATVTYNIIFEPIQYTIRFNANNTGYEGTVPSDITATYGVAYTLPTVPFTKAGYVCSANWNTEPDGSGTNYAGGSSVTNLGSQSGTIVTLYALWTEITYNIVITLYPNNSVLYTRTYQSSFTFPALPSYVGHHVDPNYDSGYPFRELNGSRMFAASQVVHSGSEFGVTANDETVYYIIYWVANTYSIAFDANGGTGSMSSQTDLAYDTVYTLARNTFTRDGYVFLGWSDSASGQVQYADGDTVNGLSPLQGATVTLYAIWGAISTVSFDANGGTVSPASVDTNVGVAVDLPPQRSGSSIVKEGYVFKYWYDETNDGPVNSPYAPDRVSVTLIAHWGHNVNVIVVDHTGARTDKGTVKGTGVYSVGDIVTLSVESAEKGYVFEAWCSDASFQSSSCIYDKEFSFVMGGEEGTEADVTYYVRFCNYTAVVYLDSNGGTFKDGFKTIYTTATAGVNAMYITFPQYRASNSNITPPNGMGRIRCWECLKPYDDVVMPDNDDNDQTSSVILHRGTREKIVRIYRPLWTPLNTDEMRAVVTTQGGYPAMDLGCIQKIKEVYTTTLNAQKIMCKGYTGTFGMDLGVQKDITFTIIRTTPIGFVNYNGQTYDLPWDDSADSRDWSNKKWISEFKNLMNRWQLETNGSQLYLKMPTTDENGDDMSDLYTEIDGDNVYLGSQNIPVSSSEPRAIQLSIPFKCGTLYPKSPIPDMLTVTYIAGDHRDPSSAEWTNVEKKYTKGITVFLPAYFWSVRSTNAAGTVTYYFTQWLYKKKSEASYDPGKHALPGSMFYFGDVEGYDFKGDIQSYEYSSEDVNSYFEGTEAITPTGGTVTLAANVIYDIEITPTVACPLLVDLISGGGGGGGSKLVDDVGLLEESWSGGGGGASGKHISKSIMLEAGTTYTGQFTIGAGGNGGGTSEDGGTGQPSRFELSNTPSGDVEYVVYGGNGGKAPVTYRPEGKTYKNLGYGGTGGTDVTSGIGYDGGDGGSGYAKDLKDARCEVKATPGQGDYANGVGGSNVNFVVWDILQLKSVYVGGGGGGGTVENFSIAGSTNWMTGCKGGNGGYCTQTSGYDAEAGYRGGGGGGGGGGKQRDNAKPGAKGGSGAMFLTIKSGSTIRIKVHQS